MKAFFAKYSGVTHTLAVIWAFLIAAYAGSDQVSAAVNSSALAVYHSMPHSLATVVSAGFAIVASLWAFYRNGMNQNAAANGSIGGQAAKAAPIVLGMLFLGLLLPLAGCNAQQTGAELVTALGTAVASLETIEGNSVAAVKVQTDTTAAAAAFTNWKAGTPAQDVIEALNLVEDDLNLLPVSPQDQALVDLGIGVVDELLALLPAPASTVQPAVYRGSVQMLQASDVKHRHPKLKKPVKSVKEFKKQWNAIVATHPELKAAAAK